MFDELLRQNTNMKMKIGYKQGVNKKQILFIHYDLGGGGAEKSLLELLGNFDYDRYEVTLCLVRHAGVRLDEIPASVKVISLYTNELIYRISRRIPKNFLIDEIYLKLKIKRQYDVIISYLEGQAAFCHNIILSRGKKNISWVHRDFYTLPGSSVSFRSKTKEGKFYEKMDDIVFVSFNAMQGFKKIYPIDVRMHCLYNIIDVNKIRKQSGMPKRDCSEFLITSIGSLVSNKGFDRLIRAAKRLKDEGLKFRIQILGEIVSFGNNRELKALRDDLGLQDQISFLGFVQPPYSYLAQSDLFVSASDSEGLPLVICEAIALGIPVVATKTAGAMELLDNGKYGILTDFDDDSLYRGIKKLLDNEALRLEFKEKSITRTKIFDVDKTMQQVYALL